MFTFKKFVIRQDRCAMKVGTDGVLLGAWAAGGRKILDIGSGTGLISLMMAQRFADAEVRGIDIDAEACLQASENVAESPFGNRVVIENLSLMEFLKDAEAGSFDCLVSNPPFFEDSLECPDGQRTMARHTSSLPFSELIKAAERLLDSDGVMSIIVPTDRVKHIEEQVALCCMYVTRRTDVKTVERKQPKRTLLEIRKKRPDATDFRTEMLMEGGERSEWYSRLTADFYL